jgi:hypothetical protein
MNGEDMPFAEREIVNQIVPVENGGVLKISDIRVYAKPRRVDLPNIAHSLTDGIHKRCFHRLERQHHAGRRGKLHGLLQIFQKPRAACIVAGLVINVVSGQLDHRHAYLSGEVDRFFHDRK